MGIRQPQRKPYQATESSQTPSRFPVSGPTTKAPTQRDRIISLLRERGNQGALNYELARIGLRYSSRLRECRIQGFKIETDHIREGLYRYRLVEEPVTVRPLPTFERKPREVTTLPLFPPATGADGRP